jgi:hypothetical protein
MKKIFPEYEEFHISEENFWNNFYLLEISKARI